MFLGNVDGLGSEVKAAFVNAVNSAVQKVVRGVLLTRPGFEERAAVASNLQVQGRVRVTEGGVIRSMLSCEVDARGEVATGAVSSRGQGASTGLKPV